MRLNRGAGTRTHGESDFAVRDVLPGDANLVLIEPQSRQIIVVLSGNTITARPTLEPRSVEGIFLHQIYKCQLENLRRDYSPTMMIFSILRKVMSVTIAHQHVDHVQNIRNIGNITALTQRTNGEPVTAITIGVAEVNVARWAVDREAVVSIEDDVILK